MQAERAELYFRQGGSDKVYHLQLENGGASPRCTSSAACRPRFSTRRIANATNSFPSANTD
jgi:hypothetical protein